MFAFAQFSFGISKNVPVLEIMFVISKNVPTFLKEISFSKAIRQFEKCLHSQNTQF